MVKPQPSVILILTTTAFLTSACSSSFYDQSLNESQALRNCYAAIRDEKIDAVKDCSDYATFHAPLYSEIDQSNPTLAACSFSKHSLTYVQMNYKGHKSLMHALEKQVATDCDEEGRTKMFKLSTIEQDLLPYKSSYLLNFKQSTYTQRVIHA